MSKEADAAPTDPGWEVLGGLNYRSPATGKARRVEPGQVVHDLPARDLGWLREQGYIRRPLTADQKAAERAALAAPDAPPVDAPTGALTPDTGQEAPV